MIKRHIAGLAKLLCVFGTLAVWFYSASAQGESQSCDTALDASAHRSRGAINMAQMEIQSRINTEASIAAFKERMLDYRYRAAARAAARAFVPTEANADEMGFPVDPDIPVTCDGVMVQNGNKIHREVDFESAGEMPLMLSRIYSKSTYYRGAFGRKWLSSLDYKLKFVAATGPCVYEYGIQIPDRCPPNVTGPGQIKVLRSNGADYTYTYYAATGDWTSGTSKLVKLADRYVITTETDGQETYDLAGRPLSILNKHGVGWTFTYDPNPANPGLITRVTHSSGRYMVPLWENDGMPEPVVAPNGRFRIKSITDPDGKIYTYSYNSNGYLTGVVYPQNSGSRTYHYELGGQQTHALTGISIDGNRFNFFSYDSQGRVLQSDYVHHTNPTTFAYSAAPYTSTDPQWTDITNAKGTTYRYNYGTVTGIGRTLVNVTGPAANACPATSQAITYSGGYPDLETNWNGNTTDSEYNTKGQLLRQVSGPAGAQRSTVMEWAADHNAISRELEYAGLPESGILLKETVYEYYPANHAAKFRPKSVSVINRSVHGVASQTRTTLYTYTIYPSGLINTVTEDGPILGTVDVKISKFSSAGDLLWTENTLGQRTTMGAHNGWGLPTTTTDPNGNLTTLGYDPRGRSVSNVHTVNGFTATTVTGYTRFGDVFSETVNGEQVLKRTYGQTGLLGTEGWSSTDPYYALYEYDILGTKTQEQMIATEMIRDPQCGTTGEPGECPRIETPVTKFARMWTRDSIGRATAELGNNQQINSFTQYCPGKVVTCTFKQLIRLI